MTVSGLSREEVYFLICEDFKINPYYSLNRLYVGLKDIKKLLDGLLLRDLPVDEGFDDYVHALRDKHLMPYEVAKVVLRCESLPPSLLASLPEAVRLPIVESYNSALIPIFTYLIPLAIIACVFLLFLKEKALAEKIENEAIVDSLRDQFAVNTGDGKSRLGGQKTA